MRTWNLEKRDVICRHVWIAQFVKQLLTMTIFWKLGTRNFDNWVFDFFRSGPEVFLAKIGNMDKVHSNLVSFSNYLNEPSDLDLPTLFLNFYDFPARFADFRKLVLSKLELTRRAKVTLSIYCDFFGTIHSLDDDRYLSILTQWHANGRLLAILKRKI